LTQKKAPIVRRLFYSPKCGEQAPNEEKGRVEPLPPLGGIFERPDLFEQLKLLSSEIPLFFSGTQGYTGKRPEE